MEANIRFAVFYMVILMIPLIFYANEIKTELFFVQKSNIFKNNIDIHS